MRKLVKLGILGILLFFYKFAQADDNQDQSFMDNRIRPRAEQIRILTLLFDDDIAHADTVYNDLSKQSPTWHDSRQDAVPVLLTPADFLAINAFEHDVRDFIKAHSAYPVVQKACVRQVDGLR